MDYLQLIKQCNHLAFGLVMAGSLVQSEEGTGNNFAASYLLMNCYFGRPFILSLFLLIELSWILAAHGALLHFLCCYLAFSTLPSEVSLIPILFWSPAPLLCMLLLRDGLI